MVIKNELIPMLKRKNQEEDCIPQQNQNPDTFLPSRGKATCNPYDIGVVERAQTVARDAYFKAKEKLDHCKSERKAIEAKKKKMDEDGVLSEEAQHIIDSLDHSNEKLNDAAERYRQAKYVLDAANTNCNIAFAAKRQRND